MIAYAGKRLALAVPTLLGVFTLIFLLLRVLPGDVVETRMRAAGAAISDQVLAAERQRLGLDQPLATQYFQALGGLFVGDLGTSLWTERPVVQEIATRLPASVEIALLSMVIAVSLAIPLGTLAALHRDTPVDHGIRLFAMAGTATSAFWLGMLITMALLVWFNWLPPLAAPGLFTDPLANLAQMIWPALAIGYRYSAVLTRMIRSSILEVMGEDYVRAARARGMPEAVVVIRHALPNALLPAVTLVGVELALLVGGLVVVEIVFNINGIGRLLVTAIGRHDLIMVQGIVMVLAVFFVLINLLVDLVNAAIDPRVRLD